MNNKLVFFSAFFFYPVFVLANWCPQWSQPKAVGYLNSDVIDEASGIEVSPLSKQRLFHINDSGDGPHFYTSDLNGNDTKTISIKGFSPVDVEDLTLGPCLDKKSCLFIGDIGDNNKVREDIVVVLIEEKPSFDKEVSPSLTLRLKYPDGPHNAEGIAVHPNGDLYILTKEFDDQAEVAKAASLFRLKKEDISSAGKKIKPLEKVGEFNFPSILGNVDVFGQIVTAFDISADGKTLLVLTYRAILEIKMDLATGIKPVSQWIKNKDYRILPVKILPQQEAITYGSDGKSIFYTTEYHARQGKPVIYEMECLP